MADPSATPLSNADFRKLLQTPRTERGGGATPLRGGPSSTPRGQTDAKAKKPYRPKPKPKEATEEDDAEAKYRDRAEERRRGINPDYESANQLAAALPGDIDVSKLSVEESKFLGGDIDHTHLVKGLDFALLQKERSKLSASQQEEAARGVATAAAAAAAAAKASKMGREAMAAAAAAAATAAAMGNKEEVVCNAPMARHVYNLLFHPPKSNIADMFLPRRMAFVFNFDNDEEMADTDIPTTLRRSKADCPAAQESVFASLDNHVLERIAKIMSYLKATAGGKKLKKKERDELLLGLTGGDPQQQHAAAAASTAGTPSARAAPAGTAGRGVPAAAADDEEDIFGDAGTDYKPSVSKKKDEASGRRSGSYFGSKGEPLLPPPGGHHNGTTTEVDMDIEDGQVPPPPPPPGAAAAAGRGPAETGRGSDSYRGPAFRSEEERIQEQEERAKWRVRAGKTEEKQVDFEEAAYGECYPMQAGFGGEVVDSDEEDMSQMDTAKGKSRYDFNTEEEWERYKETREQMPKAAFQFGVKSADGRKSGKDVGDKAKEGKMNSQLHKIEKLLKEKGHDHGGAFKKPAAATPRRESDFNDPSLTPARGGTKRQRI